MAVYVGIMQLTLSVAIMQVTIGLAMSKMLRAAIACHKTCFILWHVIVAHPKDLWCAIKKILRYNNKGSP